MRIALDAPRPDWDSFEFALDCPDLEIRSYYDTLTGEVCVTGPFEDDPGERERIDGDPARYLEIGRIDSREEYGWMAQFAAEEVADARLRERLLRALDGRGSFRRFRDALQSAPDERERWLRYRDRNFKRSVERWFVEHDLAVGAPPPWWEATPAGASRHPD